jgi:hypothetical protein
MLADPHWPALRHGTNCNSVADAAEGLASALYSPNVPRISAGNPLTVLRKTHAT